MLGIKLYVAKNNNWHLNFLSVNFVCPYYEKSIREKHFTNKTYPDIYTLRPDFNENELLLDFTRKSSSINNVFSASYSYLRQTIKATKKKYSFLRPSACNFLFVLSYTSYPSTILSISFLLT